MFPNVTQFLWFLGLIGSVCTTLLAESMVSTEPWHRVVVVFAALGTATSGYMLQHPWDGQDRRKE